MSEQALDLTRSMRILRRHKILVGAFAVLGLLAGAGYSVYKPPVFTTSTQVYVPFAKGSPANSSYIGTQVYIARSGSVLAAAELQLASEHISIPLATLRDRVQTASLSGLITITAEGRTRDQAVNTVDAMANSYIAYLASPGSPVGQIKASRIGPAAPPTGTSIGVRAAETAVVGLLPGLLIGIILALAMGRGDRRLRERDQIADSIGIPVLASIATEHPRDAAGWARLLERYKPAQVDGWHLRKALFQLGLVVMNPASSPVSSVAADEDHQGASLAVLSLASDRAALALGPQLAAFTASIGIRTALVIGPQQSETATATLYAACAAAPPLRSGQLQVAVADHDNIGLRAGVALTITIGVVDPDQPHVAATMRAATTVLGVSAGAATAEQLARVATSAAVDDREIAGIIVADPDPSDQTTGRMPQVGRPSDRRMPTRHARSHQ